MSGPQGELFIRKAERRWLYNAGRLLNRREALAHLLRCIIATGDARDERSALVIPVTAGPFIQDAACLLEIYFLQIVLAFVVKSTVLNAA